MAKADSGRAREDDRLEQAEERVERQPMGGYSQNLKVSGLPENMVGRWFNDTGDRLRQARAAGYQPVYKDYSLGAVNVSGGDEADMEQWMHKKVGVQEGAPLYAFLMAIRKEWYLEDQKRKAGDLDAVDESIKSGNTLTSSGTPGDTSNTYVKQADIEQNVPLRR